MKTPKLQVSHSPRIACLMREEAAKMPPVRWATGDVYQPTDGDVLALLAGKLDCADGWYSDVCALDKKLLDGVAKKVCKRCCKEFEAAQAVWVSAKNKVWAFPGSEDEALAQIGRALDEVEVERKLAPLLKEEFKDKVHKFLASRAIFAKRGGRYKAKQYMQHWADGYMAAWEKFDGIKVHQRPYILTPKYGNGCSGVAYLLAIPPDQLLKEAEEVFSVHMVMSV